MGQHVLHDPSVTVVRADVVEAWALHAYALQNLPGYTSSVRRAVLCWCADARVAYVEYLSVGWRLWRASEWIGPASDLGSPKPAPAGFELARRLRLYRVRERSMVLTVGGVDRIISFTGEDRPARRREASGDDVVGSRPFPMSARWWIGPARRFAVCGPAAPGPKPSRPPCGGAKNSPVRWPGRADSTRTPRHGRASRVHCALSGRCDVIDVVVGSPGAVVEIDAVAAGEGAGNRPRPRKVRQTDVRSYLALLRGVNVGGKSKLVMSALSERLTDLGLEDVSTVLATGNVLLRSSKPARTLGQQIESVLVEDFGLHQEPVKVLVLSAAQVKAVVEDKPDHFGDEPDTYHCDAIFLIGISASSAMTAFNPREGVDRIWQGEGVIYSQRLSAQRTKSRLSTVMSSPLYKSMTIRSWSTTVKLNNRLGALDASRK
jgi:uncharacterized protein (DUF1697 family)